jgi:hypothetical protein
MDWLDPTDNQRVVLAVIRLPATDHNNYGGPVFFNPGVSSSARCHKMARLGTADRQALTFFSRALADLAFGQCETTAAISNTSWARATYVVLL